MNNDGWGLRVELVFILVFLICLVVSTILLDKIGLFDEFTYGTGNSNYSEVESDLVNATKKYINQNYDFDMLEDVTLVKYSTLKEENIIDSLVDYTNNKCTGYVEVKKDESLLLYYPYIKCNKYVTLNYDSSKDW